MPPKKSSSSASPSADPEKLSPKDMVLAKMPRYPQWPAFIMPQELIPQAVLKVKKKSTNFCVIFIPDGDFYWMTEKSLEPLTRVKLDSILDKIPEHFKKEQKKKKRKASSTINEAFAATSGLDFDAFIKGIFKERRELLGEEDEDDEEDEEDEVDEEDEEQGEEDDDDEDVEEEEIDIKNDDEEKEIGQNDQAPPAKETLKKPKSIAPRSLRNGKRTKIHDDDVDSKPSKKKIDTKKKEAPLTEEEKQRQVMLCRIRLQRSLIQRNQSVTPEDLSELPPPSDQELTTARLILYRLAGFPISVSLLKSTKIHKVLKCILKEESLAYRDSFKLHEKCEELLTSWDPLIQSLKVEKSSSPLTAEKSNGVNKIKANGANGNGKLTNGTDATEPPHNNSDSSILSHDRKDDKKISVPEVEG